MAVQRGADEGLLHPHLVDVRRRRDGSVRGRLTDAAAIASVLVEQARSFRKAPSIRMLTPALGDGIFTSEGDDWLRHRRLMQPAFSRHNIERYAEVMVRRTAEAVDTWARTGEIDALVESRRLTLGIAVECLFGSHISEREALQIARGVHIAGTDFQARINNRLRHALALLPTPSTLRTRLAIRRLNRLVDRIVRQRRQAGGQHDDLLSLLEAAADPEKGVMTDRELRDEVNTLMLSGHETTALTLAWALYELARHPDVDAALAQEVAEVLPAGRLPTAADLPRLRVAGDVVRETLRLYPPLHTIAREALHDVEVGGRRLKKGSRLRISLFAQHRQPDVFVASDEFRPARWSEGLEKQLPKGNYLPFGMGPRMCIGSHFATMELVLALATIRRGLRLSLGSDAPVRPIENVTFSPDRPIRLRVALATAG